MLVLLFILLLPTLIGPVEQFEQGPGAAVAYVSLVQQLRAQEGALTKGGRITLRFTEAEWNGLLASAILSGRGEGFPVKRIRSALLSDGVRLDSIIEPPPGALPGQFERPLGLQVDLHLIALDERTLSFELSSLRLGYLTVPNYALRELAPRLGNPLPGFDSERLRLTMPLADMVEAQIKRSVKLSEISLQPGQVILTAEVGQVRQ
ncbi:MAG TPA: hypothetical protein VK191_06905 [Symbiobacteriaceae bacterium]|nr:hypothetical protein [Symbiobacteriaceae bacterium]